MKSSRSHISPRTVILSLVLLVTGNTVGLAANGPEQELDRVLMPIQSFATAFCGDYPKDTGILVQAELSGNAELKGLLNELVDAGIDGEISADWYSGMLRDDIGAENDSVRNCRIKVLEYVFEYLEKRIRPDQDDQDAEQTVPSSEESTGGASLHSAVREDNPEAVRRHLDASADPNARDPMGRAPLHIAARYANHRVVTALLNADAEPNVRDPMGRTSLHIAARYANHRVATALLNAGAEPNVRDNEGRTSLHIAARYADRGVVTALLNAGADPNARDNKRRTPLHFVARYNNTKAATVLLSVLPNAGPDVRDNAGYTALHLAA